MNCHLEILDRNERHMRLVCRYCNRQIEVPTSYPLETLARKCTSRDEVQRFPHVFFESGGLYRAWTLYYFAPEEFEQARLLGERLEEDASRVGTRLRKIIQWWGYRKGSCNCEALQTLLDMASIPFIQRYQEDLTDQILWSANQLGYHPVRRGVRAMLGLAIHRERRRLAR